MLQSSENEDSSNNCSDQKVTKIFQKNFISLLPNWLFKKKSNDGFIEAIKQLKSKSKKMNLAEKGIFINLVKFGNKTVEDIMIPRSDIVAIKLNISLDELNQQIALSVPHTRTLVYNDSLDNILGFIHIKDLFKILTSKQNFDLKKIIRRPIISAPSMKLIDLLTRMRRDCVHIAVVIDEYGGTDGIVTIEDIMEEIVGKIDDEHDKKSDNDSFKVIGNNTIISNARVEVEVLEELLGVKLKKMDDEFDTIGGLVLAITGDVPVIGTKIQIADYVELEVIEASPRTLKQVKLSLLNGEVLSTNDSNFK